MQIQIQPLFDNQLTSKKNEIIKSKQMTIQVKVCFTTICRQDVDIFLGTDIEILIIMSGWQPWSNMTIMLWHGMIMVINTRHGVIMATS